MINIADNPLIRGQVKTADPVAAVPVTSDSLSVPSDPPAYPAKSMVLEGGRYYVAPTEK